MTKDNLKLIWNNSIIRIDKKTFYSMELDGNLATYKIKEKMLIVNLLDDNFYSKEDAFDKYLIDTIRKNIIANALDYENDLEGFQVVFEGKTLNKAAI